MVMARFGGRFVWIVNILIVFTLVISLFAGVQSVNTSRHTSNLATCVAQWADQYTLSAQMRTVANTDRLNALNKLLTDALGSEVQQTASASQKDLINALASGDTEKIQAAAERRLADLEAAQTDPKVTADVIEYLREEAAYNETAVKNPYPNPPKEACK